MEHEEFRDDPEDPVRIIAGGDHRSLLATGQPSADARPPIRLDAVFVPTNRPVVDVVHRLERNELPGVPCFLMPSQAPARLRRPTPNVHLLDYRDWVAPAQRVATSTHPRAIRGRWPSWDLDLKRNAAIEFGWSHHFNSILLLDDDISGLREQHFRDAGRSLRDVALAGALPESFPDSSVAGHVGRLVGHGVPTFLSGSCLFINLDRLRESPSFFPGVYNEDWLFMYPLLERNSCATAGTVAQDEYDPFDSPDRALLQEFGDILAEGLFRSLHDPRSSPTQLDHWVIELGERGTELEFLAENLAKTAMPERRAALRCLQAASRECAAISAEDLQSYYLAFMTDLSTLAQRLGANDGERIHHTNT